MKHPEMKDVFIDNAQLSENYLRSFFTFIKMIKEI